MTTNALEELNGGGLGSCQAGEDLSALTDPCQGRPQEDRAQVTPRLADSSSYPPDSQEPVAEGGPREDVDARPKKTEKEPVTRVLPGPGKLTQRAGAAPRSPARKKAQATPPPPPPPPPPAASEELPWGEVSLNRCLVLASLVALLGSAFQLCRDAVAGEADTPAPVPEPWVPPRPAPKEPVAPLQKPVAWVPPPQPPALQAEARGKVPGSGEECLPLTNRGPKERPQKKERPRKERPRKEEKPRRDEKPRAAREPRGALPPRGETREGGHRPWARDFGDSENRKRQAWDSPRRPNEEARPRGRLKHRVGKGRD
ncbi:hypothetical protein MC885_016493 [Smutsia gigantea]|nr:hypothetical protein MC885_016493 [Smutsia gigantea]